MNTFGRFVFETDYVIMTVGQQVVCFKHFILKHQFSPDPIINNVGSWAVAESSCLGPCLPDDVKAWSGLTDCLAGVSSTVDRLQEKTEDVKEAHARVWRCVLAVKQAEESLPFTLLLTKNLRLSPELNNCNLSRWSWCTPLYFVPQLLTGYWRWEGHLRILKAPSRLAQLSPHGLSPMEVDSDRANHRLHEPVAKTMTAKRSDQVKMRHCGRWRALMSKGHLNVKGFCSLYTHHSVYNLSQVKQVNFSWGPGTTLLQYSSLFFSFIAFFITF